MPESANNDQAKRPSQALDLSELQNLSFGPNWSERKESHASGGRDSRGGSPRGHGDGARRDGRSGRDRRPSRRDHPAGERSGGEGRPAGDGAPRADRPAGERFNRGGPRQGGQGGEGNRDRGRSRGGFRGERGAGGAVEAPFEPVVEALFYPDDTPFKALSHAMRSSCRTYELFEIARLILDKPDRHVIVIKPRSDGKGISQLYQSVIDGLPFESEQEAIAHVLNTHLERYFEVETVACEPPKGSFPAINRCGITGVLLGPPNYHRYQAMLIEHHASQLPQLPFEKFQARIQSVHDEALIAQWMEQMSTRTHYKLKQPQEGEQELFESLEAVKNFLIAKRLPELVRKVPQARIAGTEVDSLPQGAIRKSLQAALAHQRRFPLESANNLRGRLRRLKFTIYKRKGVSFVCAVKRNFRDEDTRFSESVQALVAFIEANPNVPVAQLPERYLGVELKKAERTALPTREKAPDIESVPAEEARKIVEVHELKHHHGAAPASATAQSAGAEDSAEDSAAAVKASAENSGAVEGADAAQSTAAAEGTAAADNAEAAETAETAEASAEEPQLKDPRVRQLLADLRWLIAEGYVTEFGDGRLYAPPALKASQPRPGDDDHESHGEDDAAEAGKHDAASAEVAEAAPAAPAAEPAAPPVAEPAAPSAAEAGEAPAVEAKPEAQA